MSTYNVRTLAFKGMNGIGHAEVILNTCEDAGCNIIGLQEMRRNGQSAFTAVGYVVVCSGADGGKHENKGNHGVGLAVRKSIVAGMDKGDAAVECISARLMMVRIQLKGKSNGVSFIVGYAPTLDKSTSENDYFWSSLDEVVKGVSSRDHLLVLTDANARTGMRGIGWTDSKVLGAYGRDELNDNGERLLIHATDNKLTLLNTYYATPARGISYTFQSPNRGKAQYRLDYILTRQVDRRFVRNVTARTPSTENAESDHNLVIGNVRLLGRIAPNRPKRVIKKRRATDLPRLMADPHLWMNFQNAIAAKLASPIPSTYAGSVDDMASLLTETLLSNAADIAPPTRRKQVPRGWCATEETKAELNARWQDREDARKRERSAQNDRGLRRVLKATTKQLKRTRAEAVQRFFEDYVSQLEGRIREGDQFGFYKHLKGMHVEVKKTFNSQYIKNEEDRLLRDNALTGERWVRWFHKLLNTKSPNLDPSIVDELKQWPPYRLLDDVPSR